MTMKDISGKRVPDVTFQTLGEEGFVPVTSAELFGGKTVVVFSLPGAFTPTCSSTHLPRYNELAPAFKRAGVDSILCLSVNDAFVMNAWCADQGAENVSFVPDGSGAFTEGMGALVNKDDLGFGMRSWRYSMLVRDGVIEKMFIEPEKPGDPFEVSDADTMLDYIDAKAQKPQRIAIFTKPNCGYCRTAKQLLQAAGLDYQEVEVGKGGHSMSLVAAVSGSQTVPQVFVDGELVGDSEALQAWLAGRNSNAA
ncbi:MAG: glutathione peroxidase [Pseudomonadales bacterium]|nr:MAG: glutathione peroxidase [Pseudomonadales bacterium]